MIYIAISILIYAILISYKTPKSRRVFSSVSTQGLTERDSNEVIQLSASLFEDETDEQHQNKINRLCALREARLEFQNKRMLAYHKELKEGKQEDLEAKLAESGSNVKNIRS